MQFKTCAITLMKAIQWRHNIPTHLSNPVACSISALISVTAPDGVTAEVEMKFKDSDFHAVTRLCIQSEWSG